MVECLQSNHLDMVVGRRVARGAEKNFAYRRGHQWGTAASPVTVHALDLVLPIREVDCPYSADPTARRANQAHTETVPESLSR